MDIRNVGNHNPGNIDRAQEQGKRAELKPAVLIPFVAKDDARISNTGRQTAAQVDRLAERARTDDGSRDALVESARQKLLSGELDGEAVYASTAKNLASSGFLSA